MKIKTGIRSKAYALASFIILAFALLIATPAFAYGPEGLFGGRPNPDNTAILNNPVQTGTEPQRAETVLQHARPDYDAQPIVLGSFDFFPSLEVGGSYDSNIYATPTNQQGDGIFTLHPGVNAVSNWGRHALSIQTSGDINYYADHSAENFTNSVTQVEGRYDILKQTWVSARGGYQYLVEPRTSPSSLGGTTPTTFNVYNGGVTAYRGAGILQAQLDYDVRRFDYNNPPTATGIINENFRDRYEHVAGGKLVYDITDNFKPYIKGAYNIRDYDNDRARQSDGYKVDVGSKFDFGGITSLDIYVGWLSQNYEHFAANKVNDGLDFGGQFTWNVTGLTTIALEANRSVEETTPATFDSFLATGGSATVTHELLRNILIEGNGSFTRDDFQGTASRQDDIRGLGAGTRWLINRNLYSDIDYNWTHRVSSDAGQSYVDHLVTARLGLQF